MRIVSLLPSLTELVHALGRGSELVGVTHECDYPPGVETLPHLTSSKIPHNASSLAIDQMVTDQGGSLYELNRQLMVDLKPDLILTQSQCDVCAVNEKVVRRTAAMIPGFRPVESVNPIDLDGIFAMIRRVGELLDTMGAAERLIAKFVETSERIEYRIGDLPRPRVMLLEWVDPPFSSGHWNPEIIEQAGGSEVIGRKGARSRRVTWAEISRADPEVILVSACGFTTERTEIELATIQDRRDWQDLGAVQTGRVAITDGSAYFSRPGPRLETSLRIAAAAIHPDVCGDLAPPGSWRWIQKRKQ